MMTLLWLRNETKAFEKRTPLIPKHAAKLVESGHTVVVETSHQRVFKDLAYQEAGCLIVEQGTWPNAPCDAVILGLKSLPDDTFPLIHRHIYFAHAYNKARVFIEKKGTANLLQRFKTGGGLHYDIEFLVNQKNERIASFGTFAGFAGACIALLIWAQKCQNISPPFKIDTACPSAEHALETARQALQNLASPPNILIIGAEGRCGKGVKQVLKKLNFDWVQWGKTETSSTIKRQEILNFHILFNCAYIKNNVHPFLTHQQLRHTHQLSLIADISCETSANNPLPIYNNTTTYERPTQRLVTPYQLLDIMAIDNLPSFLARDSSMDFSSQFFPYLMSFLHDTDDDTWSMASNIFKTISAGKMDGVRAHKQSIVIPV